MAGSHFIACGACQFACFSFKSDAPISSIVVSQVPEIRYVIAKID